MDKTGSREAASERPTGIYIYYIYIYYIYIYIYVCVCVIYALPKLSSKLLNTMNEAVIYV